MRNLEQKRAGDVEGPPRPTTRDGGLDKARSLLVCPVEVLGVMTGVQRTTAYRVVMRWKQLRKAWKGCLYND